MSDGTDSVISHPSRALNAQNLELENHRLQQINEQLQSNITSLREQLKEALSSSSYQLCGSENSQVLKAQLFEYSTKIEKLTQEVRDITMEKDSISMQLQKAYSQHDSEMTEANNRNQQLIDTISKLKRERNIIKQESQQKEEFVDMLTSRLKKAKAEKKKQIELINGLSQQVADLTAENEKCKCDLQLSQEENKINQTEIQSLKNQLSVLNQGNENAENEIESYKKESIMYGNSLSILETQLVSQREELEQISIERQKCLQLANLLQSALTKSEDKIEKLIQEKAILSEKQSQATIKSQNKFAQLFASNDILELELPFEGDIKDECDEIIKLPQYKPLQKIQLIINTCAHHIEEAELEIRRMQNTNSSITAEFAESKHSSSQYANILNALLVDLRNLSGLGKRYNDSEFINLVAQKTAEIDPSLRDAVINDPRFVSSDFFFTNDLTKKRGILESLVDRRDASYPLFLSQFLLNIFLRNQLETALVNPAQSSQHQNASSGSEKPKLVTLPEDKEAELQDLKNRVEKLSASRKQIHDMLKNAKKDMLNMNRADNELKTKIAQLQIQNENFRNECEMMKMKLKLANSELAARSSDLSTSTSIIHRGDENTKIAKLQEELDKKVSECAELKASLTYTQQELAKVNTAHQRQIRKMEDNCKREVQQLLSELEIADNRKKQTSKLLKRKEKEAELKYKNAISSLTNQLDETKQAMNASINTLTEKAKEANELSAKLTEQIHDSEAKASKYADLNGQLSASQKALQLELNTLRQQMAKERQHIQGQLSAQMMAYETKIQQVQLESRAASQKQLKDVIGVIHDNIGVLYGLEEGDLGEDTLKQLVLLVKSDLEKLKYFQKKSTKYQPAADTHNL